MVGGAQLQGARLGQRFRYIWGLAAAARAPLRPINPSGSTPASRSQGRCPVNRDTPLEFHRSRARGRAIYRLKGNGVSYSAVPSSPAAGQAENRQRSANRRKKALGATPKAHSGPLSRARRIGLACEWARSDTHGRHDATLRSTAEAVDIVAGARRSARSLCTASPTSRFGGVTPRPIS